MNPSELEKTSGRQDSKVSRRKLKTGAEKLPGNDIYTGRGHYKRVLTHVTKFLQAFTICSKGNLLT